MSSFDPSRLYSSLLNTGLQSKDNPLYQVIHDMIRTLTTINTQVNTSSSSSGIPGPIGPQGLQGIPGIPGTDADATDDIFIHPNISSQDLSDISNVALLNRTPQAWTGRNNYTAPQNNYSIYITGNTTVGQSFGMQIQAGTNTADNGFTVVDAATGLNTYFQVRGDGKVQSSFGVTGSVAWTIANTLAGFINLAQLIISTDAISNLLIQGFSSTFTTSGYQFANGGAIANAGAGGLSFAQTGTGDIRFYTTGSQILRMKIATGGIVSTTSALRANGATIAALSAAQIGTGFAQGFALLTVANDAFLEMNYNGTVWKISATYQTSEGYKPIALFTSETERLRIGTTASGGGVMIGGTTDPGNTNLSVAGQIRVGDTIAPTATLDVSGKLKASSTGLLTTYNNIVTKGIGISAIYGIDNRTGLTTADGAAITLYTTIAANNIFRVSADIFATAAVTGTATYTITWTENATTQTMVVTATVINTLGTVSNIIRPDNATTITAQLTGVFTGTFTLVGLIEQIA